MQISRRTFSLGALASSGLGLAASLGISGRAAASSGPLSALWWDWKPWNDAAGEIFANLKKESGIDVQLNLTPFDDLNRSARSIPQQKSKPSLVLVTSDTHLALAALGIL